MSHEVAMIDNMCTTSSATCIATISHQLYGYWVDAHLSLIDYTCNHLSRQHHFKGTVKSHYLAIALRVVGCCPSVLNP